MRASIKAFWQNFIDAAFGASTKARIGFAFLLAGFALIVGVYFGHSAHVTHGAYVEISGPSGLVQRLPLDSDREFLISSDNVSNLLVIKDGQACIAQASCPNQDCVQAGWISNVGQQIACVPNKILVTIISDDDSASAPIGADDAAQGSRYDIVVG